MGIRFDKISISGSVSSAVTPIAPSYWIATAGISSLGSTVDSFSYDAQGNFYVAGRINSYTSLLYKFSSTGQLLWARSVTGNSSYTTLVPGTAVDSENNAYLVQYERNSGFTYGIVHVIKVSSSGNLLWNRSIVPSSGLLTATKFVQRKSDESLILVGEVSPGSQGANDAFYAEISTSGVISNMRSIGDASSQLGHAIALDDAGNIYIGGWGSWALGTQSFVSKWNSSHQRTFARTISYPGSSEERIYDISANNDVHYSVGESQPSGDRTAVITKYDSAGSIQWVRRLGSIGIDYFYSSVIDDDGSVYVSGYTSGTAGSLPGILLAKYLSNGTLSWQRVIEKTSTGTQPAGILIDGDSMVVAASGSYGASLLRLPKDGSMTGVYDSYNYRISTHTSTSVTFGNSNITPTSVTRTVPTSTSSLPFSNISPTSSIIAL